MLIVLSPAKSLDLTPAPPSIPMTTPQMGGDIAELSKTTAKLKAADLKQLMGVSDKLAELNRARFQAFDPACEDGVQAALAFNGDVYAGLKARELDKADLQWAQDRIRILSGLYGVLRPLDAIQPYRLEMGVRLKTRRGATLYDFWGARIAKALNAAAEGHEDKTLINLASQEYFGAVDAKALDLPVVTCLFKDEKDGQLRTLGFYAKAARGMMARFAVDQRIDRPEGLKDFTGGGYGFDAGLSTLGEWVFTRPQPPLVSER